MQYVDADRLRRLFRNPAKNRCLIEVELFRIALIASTRFPKAHAWDIDDAVSDATKKMLERKDRFDRRRNPFSYFFEMAHRAIKKSLARASLRRGRELPFSERQKDGYAFVKPILGDLVREYLHAQKPQPRKRAATG